jgi:hypothetical protein
MRRRDLSHEMPEDGVLRRRGGGRMIVRRGPACLREGFHAGARQQRHACHDAANEHTTTDD